VWILCKFLELVLLVFFIFTLFLILYYYSIRIIIIALPTKRPNFSKKSNIYLKKRQLWQQESIWTVLITVVGVLGSASAWRFYEKRSMRKERDEEFIRHDCKDRIAKLEALLQSASKEKDEMRQTILKLTEQVAALTVKVEFLQNGGEKK
jgi:ABC-type amino acid transport system permease subunit